MQTLAILFWNRLVNTTAIALTGALFLWIGPSFEGDVAVGTLILLTLLILVGIQLLVFHPGLARRVRESATKRIDERRAGRLATRIVELSDSAQILGSLSLVDRCSVYGIHPDLH